MCTMDRVFTHQELLEKNRDQELNPQVERVMTSKVYEVNDAFHEPILTTRDKEEAILILGMKYAMNHYDY